jgi:hypothetical protein
VGAVVGVAVGAAVIVGAEVGVATAVGGGVAIAMLPVGVATTGVLDGPALGAAMFTHPATTNVVTSAAKIDFDTLMKLPCVKR